ncbi:MAG: hypothetical protein EXR36_14440 [Betaproteobacteria bacterium]|nr:hypothetical protein [Betaproteobacteria bacterium]
MITKTRTSARREGTASGKLRIGDDWNAITIIALSQDNPLKAIAEFVENSIDAGASNVTITRGKERGEHFLMVADDGKGVPKDKDGTPDFRYVATHICDSIKRQLKAGGLKGGQGEFGIGLLSFWTVGEELAMACAGEDGKLYEMQMRKGDPSYHVSRRGTLVPEAGTRLKIAPLLPGVRQISGEKIQWYLASELRERIRASGVQVKVLDRQARKEFSVEPRQFTGELLHHLPSVTSPLGEAYAELYLNPPDAANHVGLYRSGTRIVQSVTDLAAFKKSPWNDGYLQGMVEAPFLNLTPATRTGVIHDAALEALSEALVPLEQHLLELIDAQKRAEEERSSKDTLRSIQRAFREAMFSLPVEEYEFFGINVRQRGTGAPHPEGPGEELALQGVAVDAGENEEPAQRQFFEFAGPLYSVKIAPASCTLAVGTSRTLRAVPRDMSRRVIDQGVTFSWRIADGEVTLENTESEYVTFSAPTQPCLVRLALSARQGNTLCESEAIVTVTDSLLPESKERSANAQGLPNYTLEHAPGKLWRSRHDTVQNVIVINSGHRDFVFSSRVRTTKLRYLIRLYAKELVRRNFPGLPPEQLLDRLIELSLYAEEHIK